MRLGPKYLQMSRDAIVIDLLNLSSRSFATSILKIIIIFRNKNTETLTSLLPILFQVPECSVIHFLVLLISIELKEVSEFQSACTTRLTDLEKEIKYDFNIILQY